MVSCQCTKCCNLLGEQILYLYAVNTRAEVENIVHCFWHFILHAIIIAQLYIRPSSKMSFSLYFAHFHVGFHGDKELVTVFHVAHNWKSSKYLHFFTFLRKISENRNFNVLSIWNFLNKRLQCFSCSSKVSKWRLKLHLTCTTANIIDFPILCVGVQNCIQNSVRTKINEQPERKMRNETERERERVWEKDKHI